MRHANYFVFSSKKSSYRQASDYVRLGPGHKPQKRHSNIHASCNPTGSCAQQAAHLLGVSPPVPVETCAEVFRNKGMIWSLALPVRSYVLVGVDLLLQRNS